MTYINQKRNNKAVAAMYNMKHESLQLNLNGALITNKLMMNQLNL